MTKITVYKNNAGDIAGFRCMGHSGFAGKGKDIVCAAVSVLVLNTVNSIEKFTGDGFRGEQDEENAVIDFRLEDGYSEQTQLLLKSMVFGLTNIEAENKKFISITFEEV